ncbi:hypothetical protein K9L16_01660 [Candidatus Pacearchaeota archaeon]|nr:hypothetical protein [Candidatus Pacearchaeota archaeon]
MSYKKDKILLSITGSRRKHWQEKLAEIEKYKIKKIALFLEIFTKKQRQEIYSALLNSNIKEIPFVHARNDMAIDEFKFLIKNFKTKYFNIHENSFKYLDKWKGIHKKLLLEMNYNNQIPNNINIKKIKGFCIDVAHFTAARERGKKEYLFIMRYQKNKKLFKANHISGYSYFWKRDLHKPKKLKQFNYLQTIPDFIFGDYIAIEVFNSIKEQIQFKDHIYNLIKDKIK